MIFDVTNSSAVAETALHGRSVLAKI